MASDEWAMFARSLKRIVKDALRLAARSDRDAADYNSKRARIEKRLDRLCDGTYENADAARLAKRLLGWKPRVSLAEGIPMTVRWIRANQEWLASVKSGEYQQYYREHYHESHGLKE